MNHSKSGRLTREKAATIKALLKSGKYLQQEIAALLHLNQGRVSEVKNGKRFADVTADTQLQFDY
jgi:predicted XRE-type DNA-binding protein